MDNPNLSRDARSRPQTNERGHADVRSGVEASTDLLSLKLILRGFVPEEICRRSGHLTSHGDRKAGVWSLEGEWDVILSYNEGLY